jgi:hypothetical protein
MKHGDLLPFLRKVFSNPVQPRDHLALSAQERLKGLGVLVLVKHFALVVFHPVEFVEELALLAWLCVCAMHSEEFLHL